jgi:hypothetical protein
METIGKQEIWSLPDGATKAETRTCTQVRKGRGHKVESFLELATKVAELQFMNRDHVLLFRGQTTDHRNVQNNTTLKPTLFRPKSQGNPSPPVLINRFDFLRRAEQQLIQSYQQKRFIGLDRLKRHQIVRWAILQHYEVCPTPLLDVTHSLRVAASFASSDANNEAFIIVLGVPNLSGAITASAEAGVQIVRLSSVCPPSALRPHIQEGYLLGEYPEMIGYEQKELYAHYEIDFGRRLVAKFRFDPGTFWKPDAFPKVERKALYPSSKDDPLRKMTEQIKKDLNLGN